MALEIISIHVPPRGATVWLDEEPLDWPFQFTHLREGRRFGWMRNPSTGHFNSRPSARGDTHASPVTNAFSAISIHAPPRGATSMVEKQDWLNALFQFTPLREGRHQQDFHVCICKRISIHAPPRGATADVRGGLSLMDISIHAPPRGATALRQNRYVLSGHISIHAPPRGATGWRRIWRRSTTSFQFTPLREGRLSSGRYYRVYSPSFQFTPLREGRRRARH